MVVVGKEDIMKVLVPRLEFFIISLMIGGVPIIMLLLI